MRTVGEIQTTDSFKVPYFLTCISIGDKLIEHQNEEAVHQADAACDSSARTTAQCTDNKDSI